MTVVTNSPNMYIDLRLWDRTCPPFICKRGRTIIIIHSTVPDCFRSGHVAGPWTLKHVPVPGPVSGRVALDYEPAHMQGGS